MDKIIYSALNRPKTPGLVFPEPTLTQQHFKDEVNINTIVDRYKKTGYLIDPNQINESRKAIYGDFTNSGDFFKAQEQLLKAQDSFMALPPKLRLRFNNDPGQLIDFLDNPNNVNEAIVLGLVENPYIGGIIPEKKEPPKEASESTIPIT
ncbi:MAG: internal scaffolding protein [Arizlama microvirus]|nr:MAG: internal scaffolding protein [Arizlama microvirus]